MQKSLEEEADMLTYKEQPAEIIDRRVRQLCNKAIPLVKVIGTHYGALEAS